MEKVQILCWKKWVGWWVDVKAVLYITYSNQKDWITRAECAKRCFFIKGIRTDLFLLQIRVNENGHVFEWS
jgi:hypothetical protein